MELTITEPATLATDWLMAGLALAWALRLRDDARSDVAEWRRAFAFLALASFAGGAYHGFQALLSASVLDGLWRATLAASALSSLFLLRAGLDRFGGMRGGPWWRLAQGKFLAALVAGQAWPDFLVVLVDFAASAALVSCSRPSRRRRHCSSWAAASILTLAFYYIGASRRWRYGWRGKIARPSRWHRPCRSIRPWRKSTMPGYPGRPRMPTQKNTSTDTEAC